MNIAIRLTTVSLTIVVGFISRAAADDLQPPPWPRLGAPNLSTFYEWEFLNNANPLAPDGAAPIIGDGGGGGPLATINLAPVDWEVFDGDGAWRPPVGSGGQNVMSFQVPNWLDDLTEKTLRIQMTYEDVNGPPQVAPGFGNVTAFDPQGINNIIHIGTNDILIGGLGPLGGQLRHRLEEWTILPNPDWETIDMFVPSTTAIDQVIIDTISFGNAVVPEPSTFTLALMGILMLSCYGRRRRRR